MRVIPASGRGGSADDSAYALDPADLATAMKEDVAAGLTPVFVTANVGSTNSCAIDPVVAIGEICRRWDGAPFGFQVERGEGACLDFSFFSCGRLLSCSAVDPDTKRGVLFNCVVTGHMEVNTSQALSNS